MTLRALLLAASTSVALALPALAHELTQPVGDVVLTVTGDIARTNAADAAQFDRAMLAAMPATEIATTTIWTEGVQKFVGVSLHELVAQLGMEGDTLTATAINDYEVKIPLSDAQPGGPILAYLHNGAEMSLRTKGPLWIVYPYDDVADYRSEIIYSRSIWQLNRIKVSD
ncbi:oxidoreductase [Cognatishimia sp. SS12]|uniref:oxidoreductase n=1 Tax=Cognatishimia sp. SS12 TaxID=2979465 RepID=UPI00232E3E2E|nr:oxidoreductase [Cognatishimia sp. SS12]MDC0738874.1 oxidoreductase [Cognatishimia sp. SS12]